MLCPFWKGVSLFKHRQHILLEQIFPLKLQGAEISEAQIAFGKRQNLMLLFDWLSSLSSPHCFWSCAGSLVKKMRTLRCEQDEAALLKQQEMEKFLNEALQNVKTSTELSQEPYKGILGPEATETRAKRNSRMHHQKGKICPESHMRQSFRSHKVYSAYFAGSSSSHKAWSSLGSEEMKSWYTYYCAYDNSLLSRRKAFLILQEKELAISRTGDRQEKSHPASQCQDLTRLGGTSGYAASERYTPMFEGTATIILLPKLENLIVHLTSTIEGFDAWQNDALIGHISCIWICVLLCIVRVVLQSWIQGLWNWFFIAQEMLERDSACSDIATQTLAQNNLLLQVTSSAAAGESQYQGPQQVSRQILERQRMTTIRAKTANLCPVKSPFRQMVSNYSQFVNLASDVLNFRKVAFCEHVITWRGKIRV